MLRLRRYDLLNFTSDFEGVNGRHEHSLLAFLVNIDKLRGWSEISLECCFCVDMPLTLHSSTRAIVRLDADNLDGLIGEKRRFAIIPIRGALVCMRRSHHVSGLSIWMRWLGSPNEPCPAFKADPSQPSFLEL